MRSIFCRIIIHNVLVQFYFILQVRTAEFIDVCWSFCGTMPNDDKIVQFKELVKDETVDVNATTMAPYEEVTSPLHLVCRYYDKDDLIELIKDLLLNGADVNFKIEYARNERAVMFTGMTILHLLFIYYKYGNMIDIVQLLLENGAGVNAKDKVGWTPLHYFCRYYRNSNVEDIAQLLVERGLDVINAKDKNGMTPLHFLCFHYEKKI